MPTDDEDLKPVTVTSERISPKRTEVRTDDGELVVGGDGTPLEYLHSALAGCLNSTGSYVAHEMGIELERLEITIAGDYDPEVFLGESDDRAGFRGFDVEMTVEADADEDTLETWLDEVERRCPVSDTIQTATPVSISFVG